MVFPTRKLLTLLHSPEDTHVSSMERYYCPNCGEFSVIVSPLARPEEKVSCRICQRDDTLAAILEKMRRLRLKPKKG
jgi:hypothetical protein